MRRCADLSHFVASHDVPRSMECVRESCYEPVAAPTWQREWLIKARAFADCACASELPYLSTASATEKVKGNHTWHAQRGAQCETRLTNHRLEPTSMANKRNSSRTSSPVLRRSTQEYLRCLLLRWLGDTGKRQGTHRFMRQWYDPLTLASHLISHARRWGGFYYSGIQCYNRAKKPRISQVPDYCCCRPRNPLINQLFSKLKRPDSPRQFGGELSVSCKIAARFVTFLSHHANGHRRKHGQSLVRARVCGN